MSKSLVVVFALCLLLVVQQAEAGVLDSLLDGLFGTTSHPVSEETTPSPIVQVPRPIASLRAKMKTHDHIQSRFTVPSPAVVVPSQQQEKDEDVWQVVYEGKEETDEHDRVAFNIVQRPHQDVEVDHKEEPAIVEASTPTPVAPTPKKTKKHKKMTKTNKKNKNKKRTRSKKKKKKPLIKPATNWKKNMNKLVEKNDDDDEEEDDEDEDDDDDDDSFVERRKRRRKKAEDKDEDDDDEDDDDEDEDEDDEAKHHRRGHHDDL